MSYFLFDLLKMYSLNIREMRKKYFFILFIKFVGSVGVSQKYSVHMLSEEQ